MPFHLPRLRIYGAVDRLGDDARLFRFCAPRTEAGPPVFFLAAAFLLVMIHGMALGQPKHPDADSA